MPQHPDGRHGAPAFGSLGAKGRASLEGLLKKPPPSGGGILDTSFAKKKIQGLKKKAKKKGQQAAKGVAGKIFGG